MGSCSPESDWQSDLCEIFFHLHYNFAEIWKIKNQLIDEICIRDIRFISEYFSKKTTNDLNQLIFLIDQIDFIK